MQEAEKIYSMPSIYFLSENAVTLNFGDVIGQHTLDMVSAYSNEIQNHPFPGFVTVVPAYTSLTVFFDLLLVIKSDLEGEDCYEKVSNYLNKLKPLTNTNQTKTSGPITIPVCYGYQFGPDIEEVANINGLTIANVISLHGQAIYTVYMIGFVPGFAYLGGMNDGIAAPRKVTPRSSVPAGAVGIAGQQTGIYPLETPGGWQIIGQTPLKMFDVARAQPSLLKAGDRVIFEPISREQFYELKAGQ